MAVDGVAQTIDAQESAIASDHAAQAAFHEQLDSATTPAEYRALRTKGAPDTVTTAKPADAPNVEAKTEPVKAEEAETAEAKTARERDEAGRFRGTKPRDNPDARKESIQSEINRATWERHEAERALEATRAETARLRSEADAARQAAQPKPKVDAAAAFPQFDQWLSQNTGQSYEDYLDARAEHKIEARFAARDNARKQEEFQREADTEVREHMARVDTAKREKYPDWDAVASQVANIVPPPVMQKAILTSKRSDDIAYWLATHPTEYAQLARENQHLDPAVAAPLVRRVLESYLPAAASATSPAAVSKKSSANAPPKLVGSSPTAVDVDPEDESPEQYRARREAELAARGKKVMRKGR